MGKPANDRPYRDDPSLDDALSLHTTPDDAPDYDAPELSIANTLAVPPPYRDSEDDIPDPHATYIPSNRYHLPDLDDCKRHGDMHYIVGGFENDPPYLEWSMKRWGAVPPAKMIYIVGTHTETMKNGDKKEQKTVTDFDIKLRLTEYLFTHPGRNAWMELKTVDNQEKTFRGSILKRRDKGSAVDLERAKPELREWCHRFVADHSSLKVFYFTREVTGLDEIFLKERLETLIRTTNYKGRVSISFPIENHGVEVWSHHWINRWRNTPWICALFFISMLWIFTWPYLYFSTKKYAVVRGVWPFSIPDAEGERQYATVSEGQWFMKWQKAIQNAVISKTQGTLTEEDLARSNEPVRTLQSGSETLDSAMGLLGAGISAYNQVNRQLGWGYDT